MYTCFVWNDDEIELSLNFAKPGDADKFGQAAMAGRDVTHYTIDDPYGEEIFSSKV